MMALKKENDDLKMALANDDGEYEMFPDRVDDTEYDDDGYVYPT